MFLKDTISGDLVRVDDLDLLFNPLKPTIIGRDQAGEEEQDAMTFIKGQLVFPSGEPLPRCWTDAHYREGG